MFISLSALAIAVSLDGFGVGVTYGLRRIRIPLPSLLIITALSSLVLLISMQIGLFLSDFLSVQTAQNLGALILIGVGCWATFNISRNQENDRQAGNTQERTAGYSLLQWEMKRLGLVIQIVKTPTHADLDQSGAISASEAALLGFALSLDAFGAGIGASFIGLEPMMTSITIGLMNCFFILMGMKLGFIFSDIHWMKRFSYVPGMILIVIGILKIIS